jgi:hypothetical protein
MLPEVDQAVSNSVFSTGKYPEVRQTLVPPLNEIIDPF